MNWIRVCANNLPTRALAQHRIVEYQQAARLQQRHCLVGEVFASLRRRVADRALGQDHVKIIVVGFVLGQVGRETLEERQAPAAARPEVLDGVVDLGRRGVHADTGHAIGEVGMEAGGTSSYIQV